MNISLHFLLLLLMHACIGKKLVVENRKAPDNTEIMEKVEDVAYIDAWDGVQLEVHFSMFVDSLSQFSTNDMSFETELFVWISWHDKRLEHEYRQPYIIERPSDIEKFWIPNLYIGNGKEVKLLSTFTPNMYIRVYPNGEIFVSSRFAVTAICNQNLRYYPFDEQTCGIEILSYSVSLRKIWVKWANHRPMAGDDRIQLTDFEIKGYANETCTSRVSVRYAETDTYYMEDHFSCLFGAIHLKRAIGYHMVQTYIPTALLVVISWMSFFIDPYAVQARLSVCFTTFLTLSTTAAGLRYSLPPVSYTKAIDIWIATCTGFLFMGLIQLAVVNSFTRAVQALEALKRQPEYRRILILAKFRIPDDAFLDEHITEMCRAKEAIVRRIDHTCRFLFPILFLVFNVFYWSFYLRK